MLPGTKENQNDKEQTSTAKEVSGGSFDNGSWRFKELGGMETDSDCAIKLAAR